MKAVSIASGSKGNCYLIQSNNTNILVDQGLGLKNLEEKLSKLGVMPNLIDAIVVTHEHIDHCYGIGPFLRKYNQTKVYIDFRGYNYVMPKLGRIDTSQVVCVSDNNYFIGDIEITSFELPHDSEFCLGYTFSVGNNKVGIATDLGTMPTIAMEKLKGCDILYIESNHDENLLMKNPKYSAILKKRILSNHGHLSNKACAQILVMLVPTGIKQVVLAHLSEENNTPILAYTTVKNYLEQNGIIEGKNVYVDVAFQNEIGSLLVLE